MSDEVTPEDILVKRHPDWDEEDEDVRLGLREGEISKEDGTEN